MKWTGNEIYGINLEKLTLKDEFKKEDFWDRAENMEKFWLNHENIACHTDADNETYIGILAGFPWENTSSKEKLSDFDSVKKYLAKELMNVCENTEEYLIDKFKYTSFVSFYF